MTSLPDWLVERAALDEVPPASRERIERADPRELADGIAAVRDNNAEELARYPVGPAVAQIEAQVAQARQGAARRRRRRLSLLGLAFGVAAVLVVAPFAMERTTGAPQRVRVASDDGIRVKGPPRVLAFRQVGGEAERLDQDAVVAAGDVIQLRYNAGGQSHGVIASVDGAGAVTLHFPLSEDAPPQATAVARETTTLPHAYALDDAPRFERFFMITADAPVDVQRTLAALRSLAHRDDSATAMLHLPAGMRQSSLRLRKADRTSPNHESP